MALSEDERKRRNTERAKAYYEKHKTDPEFKKKIQERNKQARERTEQKKLVIQEKPKVDPVPEDLPADSIEKPKRTVILAEGWDYSTGKKVVVERWTVEGFPVFRTKVVICRHYKSKSKAILAARAESVRLKQYADIDESE